MVCSGECRDTHSLLLLLDFDPKWWYILGPIYGLNRSVLDTKLHSLCCILVYMFMLKYTYIYWIHTDTMIKTDARSDNDRCRKTSLTKFTSHFIARVQKGCSRFACERELETEHNWNILTPKLWPSTLCLSHSSDAQPEPWGSTLLGAGFLYCILSASSLDPNSSGPKGPFRLMWLSLPHLISLRLQLYWNYPCRTQQPTAQKLNWQLHCHWLVELNWVI